MSKLYWISSSAVSPQIASYLFNLSNMYHLETLNLLESSLKVYPAQIVTPAVFIPSVKIPAEEEALIKECLGCDELDYREDPWWCMYYKECCDIFSRQTLEHSSVIKLFETSTGLRENKIKKSFKLPSGYRAWWSH